MCKLSRRQQFILDKMKAGAMAFEVTGIDPYWFLTDQVFTPCSKQIPVLLRLGLIEVFKEDWRGRKCKFKTEAPCQTS